MKPQVSVKLITGATTKGVVHHVKGCLQDTPHQTQYPIADNIISLVTYVKKDENCVFVSGLTIRTDKLNDRETKVNEVLQRKCGAIQNIQHVLDNSNIYSNILNSSGLHLNDGGTTLLPLFCEKRNINQKIHFQILIFLRKHLMEK